MPLVLNLIVIRSKNPAKLAVFYAALGAVFEVEKHGNGPEHLAAKLGDLVLEIYPSADTADTSVRLGFIVDAIDSCVDSATSAGGTLLSGPTDSSWGRRAVLSDPDGRRVELLKR